MQWEFSTLGALADRENIVLAFPDGTNLNGNAIPRALLTWNAGGCCPAAADNDVDDVAFLTRVLDWAEETYCIDRRRIYLGGFSNGGMMTYRAACQIPERLAAVASVSGPDMTGVPWKLRAPIGCNPTQRLPLMHIHGTGDQNAPYTGGKGPCFQDVESMKDVEFSSVANYVPAWATQNGCGPGVDVPWPGGNQVEPGHDNPCVMVGGACPSGHETVLCTLPGGGHGYPQASSSDRCLTDPVASEWFDASAALWNFFRMHTRALP